MKKNIIKISFSIISLLAFIFSIISIISAIKNLTYWGEAPNKQYWAYISEYADFAIGFETYRLIFWIFCCISNVLFFLIVNIKGLRFVTDSLIETISKKKKENKKAKLEREIAQKQAELDELTNNPKTE